MSTIDKIVEEKIFKAAIAEIDIDSLAKQFKPELEKKLKAGLKEYCKRLDMYDYFDDMLHETVYKYMDKVAIPEMERQLGVAKPKPKRKTGGKK